ncbi:hypothetical protein OH76DRAFT_1413015 [Lentinus brumalis]|uniref:Uncharacterized protein n=1 Tax=Lentinus brumalis TaxID=2498619 RepID=A0A371CJD6_9APHY|nr:hypothetical protein OH76DRAFT_1413015 [Polyporus brumalis]
MDAEANDEAELNDIVEANVAPVELAADQQIFARRTLTKVCRCRFYYIAGLLTQCDLLTKRIFHSPVLRELTNLCWKHNIKPLGVVRAVATRLNSVAITSKRSLYLRKEQS